MGYEIPTKCYILSIQNKSNFFYQHNNVILKQLVPNNPYLGLLISKDLKWAPYITNIRKKANSTLGFLRCNLQSVQQTAEDQHT